MFNIIGAGLAGSILKRKMDSLGIPNRIIDCENEWRASNKSENLFSLSWANTLGHEVLTNGLKVLEGIAEIKTIKFRTKAGFNDTLHIHPTDLLVDNYIVDRITAIERYGCTGSSGTFYRGRNIICTGYWAKEYIKPQMKGLTGQGLLFKGRWDQHPVMTFVSPYLHQKVFQWDEDHIWYADSTCILKNNYLSKKDYYVDRCKKRAEAFGLHNPAKIVYGIRPQVKGFKGYLSFEDDAIINTGGWKCGLIIYADQAKKICQKIY